jgi:hypothetical protein
MGFPKSSIPIGAKVEISPKDFPLGVKAEREKNFSICPKLLINAELYGLVLAPRLKKGYRRIWGANLQPKNAQSWPPVFFALTPSVKRALGYFCSGPGLKCIGMQYKP